MSKKTKQYFLNIYREKNSIQNYVKILVLVSERLDYG